MDSSVLQSLAEQVSKLTEALAKQQASQDQLQEDLRKALADNRALRAQLRALTKRRRTAGTVDDSPAVSEPEEPVEDVHSEASMESTVGQAIQRRKSPGRESPTH